MVMTMKVVTLMVMEMVIVMIMMVRMTFTAMEMLLLCCGHPDSHDASHGHSQGEDDP
jgi:hypothetical protein